MNEVDDDRPALAPERTTGEMREEPNGPPAVERLSAVFDVPLQLSAVLGRVKIPVSQLLRLGRGAVVELDRKVGDPVDIYVNDRLVARGEVLVVEDRLGITLTEIVKGAP